MIGVLRSRSEIGKLRRTIRLVWESGPRWTVVSIALLLLQTGISLAALYLLKLWVDAVSLSLRTSDPLHALRDVGPLIFAALVVALLGSVCSVLSDLVNRVQSQAIADHVQSLVLHKAAQVELSYYENAHYYDMLHRVQFDASWRPGSSQCPAAERRKCGVSRGCGGPSLVDPLGHPLGARLHGPP